MSTAPLLPRLAGWRREAACTGLSSRGSDPWCPSEDLTRRERDFQHHLARRVCAACPVRTLCALEALDELPVHGAESMRGGLTPDELRSLARSLARPHRLQAQCGTRSAYVGGCRCDDCRNAHRAYEHTRRLGGVTRKRVLTLRAKVGSRVTRTPKTADDIAAAASLSLRDVRVQLAQEVAAGRVVVAGRHPLGSLLYVRPAVGEAVA